jgi:ferric-dicitrate binding protein FerR (iron transport regulator)
MSSVLWRRPVSSASMRNTPGIADVEATSAGRDLRARGGQSRAWWWARIINTAVVIGALVGFGYANYLILGPAVRWHLIAQWDAWRNTGMRDVIPPMKSGPRWVRFEDGSSLLLDPLSWVRYPGTFARGERSVQMEGQGDFHIRPAAVPFVVRADPITITADSADFRVFGNPQFPACAVQVLEGRVDVSPRGAVGRVVIEAPTTWRRQAMCPPLDNMTVGK